MVDDSSPVTVVVRRRVKLDAQGAFEKWLEGVIGAASAFEGHLGANVIRPANPAAQDYVVIFRFETAAQLRLWDDSETRAQWLAKVEPLTIGEAAVDKVSGLEFWFTLPGDAARKPPARWKMAVVTVIALYPLIMFLVPALAKLSGALPGAIATLFSAAVMVTLMTYAVMPALTRLFAPWLFPAK